MANSTEIQHHKPEIKLVSFHARQPRCARRLLDEGTYSAEPVEPPGLAVLPPPDIVGFRRLVWTGVEIFRQHWETWGEGSDVYSMSSQK